MEIKLVIWDRDGPLNVGRPPIENVQTAEELRGQYVLSPEEFELAPTAEQAINLLRQANLAQAIATSQRCVGRGLISENDLEQIHQQMERLLGEFDDIQVCTHVEKCECKKPKPGLFNQVMANLFIDPPNTAAVGDRASDMEGALNAAIPVRILVTWQSKRDGLFEDIEMAKKFATHVVKTPLKAAELIIQLNQE